jgi:hypothetical protein
MYSYSKTNFHNFSKSEEGYSYPLLKCDPKTPSYKKIPRKFQITPQLYISQQILTFAVIKFIFGLSCISTSVVLKILYFLRKK